MLVGLTSFKFSTGTIWAIASTRECSVAQSQKTSKWHMHDLYATIEFAAAQQEPITKKTQRFGNRCNTCAKFKSFAAALLVYWFLVCENRNSFSQIVYHQFDSNHIFVKYHIRRLTSDDKSATKKKQKKR